MMRRIVTAALLALLPVVALAQSQPGPPTATATPLAPLIQVPGVSAVALPSVSYSNGVIIQIPATNTGVICFGPTNAVTAVIGAGTKTCLSNASGIVAISAGVNNLKLLGYDVASNSTDYVQFTAN